MRCGESGGPTPRPRASSHCSASARPSRTGRSHVRTPSGTLRKERRTELHVLRAVQLVVVVPLGLAVRDGAETVGEIVGLRAFVVHERLLRGRDNRIDDTEI